MMTPDESDAVQTFHRQWAHLKDSDSVTVKVRYLRQLVNCLKQEERRGDVAEERMNKMLTKAAEENLEMLLTDA
jgi:hypothetical protein